MPSRTATGAPAERVDLARPVWCKTRSVISLRTCAGAALALAISPSAALADPTVARAVEPTIEPTIELAGGVAMPIAANDWAAGSATGWKLAGRGTSAVFGLPAVASLEWARLQHDPCGRGFDRFRITTGLAGWWPLGGTFAVSARVAVGVDAVMCGTDVMDDPGMPPTGLPQTRDHFDLGLAGEAAAALWLYRGTFDVGIEVGLPVSLHWDEGGPSTPALDYLGLDLDVLLAVRMR